MHHYLARPHLSRAVGGHTLHSTGSQTLRERHNTCIIFRATATFTSFQNVQRFKDPRALGPLKRDCPTLSSPLAGVAPGFIEPEYGVHHHTVTQHKHGFVMVGAPFGWKEPKSEQNAHLWTVAVAGKVHFSVCHAYSDALYGSLSGVRCSEIQM